MSNEEVDIIIVGAGAAGSAAAWNLSNQGFKIVCLEQGPRMNPDLYPKKESEFLKNNNFNSNPNIRKMNSDYPIDDTDSPISIANFNAVGGSTILFSGHFPRFHPSDFHTKSKDGVGEDWPFGYSELEPFYNLNDEMMGVSGLEGDPAYPSISNLLPPIPLGISGEKIANGFKKLNWHWWPSYSSISTINYKGRRKCLNEGVCNSGCPHGSKSSVDISYWPQAIKNGVDLRPNSRVLKINIDNFGNAKGVLYENDKKELKILNGSIILLACSGIGTPRLLLNSSNKLFPDGLANSSGLVGKNLMLHPLGYVEGLFDEFLESYFGPNGCCLMSQEFYETKKDHNFKRGYTMQVLRGSDAFDTAFSLRKFKKLNFGKDFHKNFLSCYGHNIPITIICEDIPELSNYIELDYNNQDSSGMPGVKVHYKLADNTKKMMSHGINRAKEVLQKAGSKSQIAFGPVRNTGWHLMGTTKMGRDKNNSVVNQFGQSHDINNLIILDSSLFTTSAGVNPVSTIQAISLKFTSNIIKNRNKFAPKI